MSHWNYRVTKVTCDDGAGGTEDVYGIREVFYDDDGVIHGWTQDTIAAHAVDGPDELRADLDRMLLAFDKPVLDVTDDAEQP